MQTNGMKQPLIHVGSRPSDGSGPGNRFASPLDEYVFCDQALWPGLHFQSMHRDRRAGRDVKLRRKPKEKKVQIEGSACSVPFMHVHCKNISIQENHDGIISHMSSDWETNRTTPTLEVKGKEKRKTDACISWGLSS
jgi:hypothetical protein